MSVVLVCLVAAVALTSRQASPPTIAEFAPQAVAQISDAPGDLAGSRGGHADAMSMLDDQTDGADAARQRIEVARVRQCVGDPPRQIEDPQSPPCVPYWSGDNGGATSRGVTRDEIRVAITPPWGYDVPWPALETFFNTRFEFYGRRLRLIPHSIALDPAGQRAAARAVYEEDKAFASANFEGYEYADELTRLGIIDAEMWPSFPETYLASRRPYLWTYPMANDREFALMGNWYCARFSGRNAVHAGDPLIQASRRKLGVMLTSAGWEGTSAEPMQAQLKSCGRPADPVIRVNVRLRDWATPDSFPPIQNAMLQMKASGVTTVACLCYAYFTGAAMNAATNQGYFPEWLVTSFIYNEQNSYMRQYAPPAQSKNLMLLLAHPMERAYADHPSNWATQEVTSGGYPATSIDQNNLDMLYRSLLLLASGFQMAGPNLTPDTFERALHRTRFPNPAHRIMAGAVGFIDGDHSMTDDAVEAWWSNTARSPEDGIATYCYVDHGARRRIGTFPTDDPFFKGECDNGTT